MYSGTSPQEFTFGSDLTLCQDGDKKHVHLPMKMCIAHMILPEIGTLVTVQRATLRFTNALHIRSESFCLPQLTQI